MNSNGLPSISNSRQLQAEPITRRIRQILSNAQITFRRLNRSMPQTQLNLLQRRSPLVRQLRKCAPKIVWSDFFQPDFVGVLLDRLEDALRCHAVAAEPVAFVHRAKNSTSTESGC